MSRRRRFIDYHGMASLAKHFFDKVSIVPSCNKTNSLVVGIILFAAATAVLAGCNPAELQQQIVIDKVVAEARKQAQKSVKENPRVFKSARVDKEGDTVLLLEYTLQPQAQQRVRELHAEYMNSLKHNEINRKDFEQMADYGVSVHVVYKSVSGETLLDERVTIEDIR